MNTFLIYEIAWKHFIDRFQAVFKLDNNAVDDLFPNKTCENTMDDRQASHLSNLLNTRVNTARRRAPMFTV